MVAIILEVLYVQNLALSTIVIYLVSGRLEVSNSKVVCLLITSVWC